ncbi:MAG: molybdenum cofactor guanylyltransferase [Chloroflexi bacterium]|nr:molybdenum cofactor guanylyltransferase [Chloroflexota bacterium]
MLPLTLVLQAGGKSTRMGQDKALVPFVGKTLIEHVLAQTEGLATDTIVITNRPDAYRFLGLPLFADVFPDKGALGGLYSAIYHAPQPHCLVLACDMPFVNRPLLKHLIALAPDFDAVMPHLTPLPSLTATPPPSPGLPARERGEGSGRGVRTDAEPFRAVYSKACLGPIRAALKAGRMRVISFFDEVRIRFVDREEIECFDPGGRSFFNINTPEELAEAERIAAEEAG